MIYKVERYADKEGREIECFTPIEGFRSENGVVYKCMVPVLTDQGIQPIPYVMKSTTLEEAFAAYDGVTEEHITRIKTQVEEIRRKQQNKLVVAQNVPPAKNNGLVLG